MDAHQTSSSEADILGAVICTSCESLYQVADKRLSCENCGHSLMLAEAPRDAERLNLALPKFSLAGKLADAADRQIQSQGLLFESGGESLREQMEGHVSCGWCGVHYDERPTDPNCTTCGGVLPPPPSLDLGDPPPVTPRVLPRQFLMRLYGRYAISAWIGVVMMVSAIAIAVMSESALTALVLFLVGLALSSNFWIARKRHRGLKDGIPTEGKIESVHRYGEQQKGSAPMYRVYFRFEANGEPVRSMKFTYDSAVVNHFVGEPVWVVYLPSEPVCCDIWPPLA
jgi:hypothetical protein